MQNFWEKLNKPFSILAPMEDVTDIVFRQIIKEVASPDVFFTEFVNCEGLMSIGKDALIHRLDKSEDQSPIVAQIWGITPENFYKSAKLVEELGVDGVDLNMGCPQRNVTKAGACSALIKNHELAKQIIKATKEGAPNLPLSVKTRIGFGKIATEEWIGFLLEQGLAALTVHLRTVKEMSAVPAHWEEMSKIIALRDKISPTTLIIGNGDLVDYQDIVTKHQQYKIDGGMIGRGIFTNPQAFAKEQTKALTQQERLELCKRHITLFTSKWGDKKKYDLLKKYYKIYIQLFDGAKELRIALMETKSSEEALSILFRYNNQNIR
jgi:tRNA-dihydrouridine synthase